MNISPQDGSKRGQTQSDSHLGEVLHMYRERRVHQKLLFLLLDWPHLNSTYSLLKAVNIT